MVAKRTMEQERMWDGNEQDLGNDEDTKRDSVSPNQNSIEIEIFEKTSSS